MYIRICVCMCICVYVHMYVYADIYICINVYMEERICVSVCACVFVYVLQVRAHVRVHRRAPSAQTSPVSSRAPFCISQCRLFPSYYFPWRQVFLIDGELWAALWPVWLKMLRSSAKADSTLRSSRAVPHPSTDRALRRLTSEVGRDPVHSTRYGRQRKTCLQKCCHKCQ